MNYAIIKDNIVSNIVEWDGVSEFSVDGDIIVCDENAYIGGAYDNGFVARPVEPSPEPTYDQLRKNEYPSIEECVHAILDDQLDALQVKRQAVKSKYPKPLGWS